MIEKDTLIKILDCCIEDDCGHYIPYCELIDYGYGWKDNDFCSRGKRK